MLSAPETFLGVDLGASSGRVMAGWMDSDGAIQLQPVRRFVNEPVERNGTLCWDFEKLISEIFLGLEEAIGAARDARRPVVSIGIDSWAVDFGLVDEDGLLTGPVVHYRDARTHGMMDEVFEIIPRREIFARTGIQFLPFNTIYQLAALKRRDPDQLARARHFMMIADLVAWRLTGQVSCEYTNATTTQLFDAKAGEWSQELLGRLGLPAEIFPVVTQPGSVIGPLLPELAGRWGAAGIQVMAVATHDTASAVVGVPATSEEFAYLSCGTWSLLGTELKSPILSDAALDANFTNEGGAEGTFRFLKNIMGLWILQECQRQWTREGKSYDWQALEDMARAGEGAGNEPIINVDDEQFLPPGDMPARVRAAAGVEGDAAVVRCVLKSLAARYREVFDRTETLSGIEFERLYVIGGGVQNRLLCECTAIALQRPVELGPAEATVLGNIGVQMIAAGRLPDVKALRTAIRQSGF